MKWLYERLYKSERGFTLIELLIVIIILAVLAGIAVPSYLTITARAKESGTETEMANIATALELYKADNNSYPIGTDISVVKTTLENGKYMTNVPTQDKWGNNYSYSSTDGTTYTLTSYGKNGTNDNGAGDDIVWTNGQQTSFGAYK